MSAVEAELVKATKVKVDKYDDRQDFLAAIAKVLGDEKKFSEADFDNLTDEAADWYTKGAAPALNKKKVVPDFPDVEEAEAEEAEDDAPEDEAPDDEDEKADPEAEPENEEQEAPIPKRGGKKPVKAAKGKAPLKASGKSEAQRRNEKLDPKTKVKKQAEADERYSKVTGEKDKFGIIKGTKTSDVVAMYARTNGATAAEIMEAHDGRYYNILAKLHNDGHRVEKLEGGRWKLTHKDEIKAKPAKKGK